MKTKDEIATTTGAPEGKQTIIPFHAPAPRTPPGAGPLATLQEQIKDFEEIHQGLEDASMHFRESLSLTSGECADVIKALQALRRKTRACLRLLDEHFPLAGMAATVDAQYLDGEITARLILELDALRSLLGCRKDANRQQTRERIESHVKLQSDLDKEAECIGELIGNLHKIPAKIQEGMQKHPSCL